MDDQHVIKYNQTDQSASDDLLMTDNCGIKRQIRQGIYDSQSRGGERWESNGQLELDLNLSHLKPEICAPTTFQFVDWMSL